MKAEEISKIRAYIHLDVFLLLSRDAPCLTHKVSVGHFLTSSACFSIPAAFHTSSPPPSLSPASSHSLSHPTPSDLLSFPPSLPLFPPLSVVYNGMSSRI